MTTVKLGPTIHSRFEGVHKSPTRWAVALSSAVGMMNTVYTCRDCDQSGLNGRGD